MITATERGYKVTLTAKVQGEMTERGMMNFIEGLQKEVEKNSKSPSKLKKLKKELMVFNTTCASFLIMAMPAGAQTLDTAAVIPPEIDQMLLKIQLICLGLAGTIAVICLMLAGITKMFTFKQASQEWTENIFQGLGQVLLAPIAVAIILTIARALLKPFIGHVPF